MTVIEQHVVDGQGALLARYWPNWLCRDVQARLWPVLEALPWQQPDVKIFGRVHPIPRRQCYLGADNCHYRYSGLLMAPEKVPEEVEMVMVRLRQLGFDFNAVLANEYRDGHEKMGWHRDNEPELAPQLAILSLGQTRRLRLRWQKTDSVGVDLSAGSLLWMEPGVYHCLTSTSQLVSKRISLTFRHIQPGFHQPCS